MGYGLRFTLLNGQYKYRMEVSQDGNQWQTFIEGHYVKT